MDNGKHGRQQRRDELRRDGGLGHCSAAGGVRPEQQGLHKVGLPGLRADDPDGH